jgi:P-type Mg2+ transporter
MRCRGRIAGRKVIVKRLASIHDLNAMSVLCTDKTGALNHSSSAPSS